MGKGKKINFLLVISLFISLIPFAIYAYYYPQMPSQIAIHYNGNGVIDRYVNKSSYEVFLMCGISLIVIIIMKLVELFILLTSKNDKNQKDNIHIIKLIMNITILAISVLFSVISIYFLIISTGVYKLNTLDIFEISNIFLGIIFIIMGNYMPKIKQNAFAGFRTKLTLSDENIWFKAQRFAGYVWIILGATTIIISIVLGHVSLVLSLSLSFIFPIIAVIIPIIYVSSLRRK